MGLLFEIDDCQYELFSSQGQGVSYINLTTGQRQYIESKEQIPETWPQNVKDSLAGANFITHDVCNICLQPQTPLCRCIMTMEGEYDLWHVPPELASIDPPHTIDDLQHLIFQAKKTVEVACVVADPPHRSKLANKAIDLIGKYVSRQRLIAQAAGAHYASAANVLRNYSKACLDEITTLRNKQRASFKDHRMGLLEALLGERTCDSCLEKKVCCVARPCMHASMCPECWEQWILTSPGTCPVCRADVASVSKVESCTTIPLGS